MVVLSCFMAVSILLLVLMAAGSILGFGSIKSREKLSSYECGFEPMGREALNFCLRFFILVVVFLVFDVELVLMVYFIPMCSVMGLLGLKWRIFAFAVVLLWGLLHEVGEGSLNWVKL
uniref:NADH-ubiquinone oxidoreductase chain 3 n=1 Tax=Macoma balthica TaxID=1903275 RepID=A0A6B7FS27_MACBL|nr:NADH dehydrogenase subunit 3 [Macoma balthica]